METGRAPRGAVPRTPRPGRTETGADRQALPAEKPGCPREASHTLFPGSERPSRFCPDQPDAAQCGPLAHTSPARGASVQFFPKHETTSLILKT